MNKNNKLGIIIAVVAIIVIIIGIAVYSSKKHSQLVEAVKKRTTLIVAFSEMPQSLNPVLEHNETGLILQDLIFDGMTNLTGERVDDYQLGLAIDLIQDAKKLNIYTAELRNNIIWHDDPEHKVTAADVKFTFDCIMKESNNSPLRGRISRLIKNIEVVSDLELKVTFHEAIAPGRVAWVLPFKIIPATYYGKEMSIDLLNDDVAKEFSKSPVGTGPFKFEKWQGNEIVLNNKNLPALNESDLDEESAKKENRIRRIETILVHDLKKQAKMLIDNKIDMILQTDPDLHKILDEKTLKFSDYTPHYFYAVAYNNKSKLFKSNKIRKALSQAINKEELANTVWPGEVKPYLNKGTFPHNADTRYEQFRDLLPYNIDKAKKILSRKKIKATMIFPEEAFSTTERIAGKLAQMYKAAGVEVETKALGMAFDTQLKNGSYELALVRHDGFTKGYDISPLYETNSKENITGFGSKRFDILLDKWRNTAFWIDKLPLSRKIHEQLLDESPYTYLFSLPTRAYYSQKLSDVKIIDPSALIRSVTKWTVN
ncbi:MAG: ABC transporter substrate-binding protein [Deltaproteobacteria bacterium]|nr:ABC transporter substrate-binding protein [Deltaproteobacteria bacterium]